MNFSITSVSVCVYYTAHEFYSRFQFCLAKLVRWFVSGRVSNCVYCTACECFFCEKPRGFYLNFEKFCIFFSKFGPKKSFLEILILGINQEVISS